MRQEGRQDGLKDGLSRRKVLAAGAATGIVGVTAAAATSPALSKGGQSSTSKSMKSAGKSKRMPVVFLPHGGGPWPFVDLRFVSKPEVQDLASYLTSLPNLLPEKPSALLVVSAHWEENRPTLMTHANPPMYYDYYGFPPESYTLQWPAPGTPALAARVRSLLGEAGYSVGEDPERGFDHGTFIPLKVSYPEADIPTTQLSLLKNLDPAEHLALGRALAPLRDEGVLIVGSGMSYHNLREFASPRAVPVAEAFDAWMQKAATAPTAQRDAELTAWHQAPMARQAHPREEHLLPLMVVAGAAGEDPGKIAWSGTFGGARITAVHYG